MNATVLLLNRRMETETQRSRPVARHTNWFGVDRAIRLPQGRGDSQTSWCVDGAVTRSATIDRPSGDSTARR